MATYVRNLMCKMLITLLLLLVFVMLQSRVEVVRFLHKTSLIFLSNEIDDSLCNVTFTTCNYTGMTIKHPYDSRIVSCKQRTTNRRACRLASDYYLKDEKWKLCKDAKRKVEICVANSQMYTCTLRDCNKMNQTKVALWIVDEVDGKSKILNIFSTAKSLQTQVQLMSSIERTNKHNFVILECSNGKRSRKIAAGTSQLLMFSTVSRKTSNNTANININMVLLDSVARSHFYRSLHRTISTFSQNNKQQNGGEVLDFELFQAVYGHTNENLRGLFTGNLFPKNFSSKDKDIGAGIDHLFGTYSRKGYTTVFQDDLCYDQIWGFRMDLGYPTNWNDLHHKLSLNSINDTGLTFASCIILNANNIDSPFNLPKKSEICFNGQTQDEYLLQYTTLLHREAYEHNLITMTTLNVGHDNTGRRIQTFDEQLAMFANNSLNISNTLTVLFADHGNTYTPYTSSDEGRTEMFHPALFLLIPENVQKKLGDFTMRNLRRNTKKLVTIIDIHDALVNIPHKTTGIFGEISSKKSCTDIQWRLPNQCICKDWDIESQNDSSIVSVVKFAVETLNEMIKKKQTGKTCWELQSTSFSNIRTRSSTIEETVTSVDFTTASGVGKKHEVFNVEVKNNTKGMTLISFDRISEFEPYRACADKSVGLLLCICDPYTNRKTPVK